MIFHPPPGPPPLGYFFGRLHRVGVGGVDTEVCPLQRAVISSGSSRPARTVTPGALPCSSAPRSVATLTRTSAPKRGAPSCLENARPSVVPLNTTALIACTPGVTIRPASSRVAALPMKTVVNISTSRLFPARPASGHVFFLPPGQCCGRCRRPSPAFYRWSVKCGPLFAGNPGGPWKRGYRVPAQNRPWRHRPAASR